MIIETNPSRVFKNKFSPAREAEWEKMIGQQVWKNPKTTSKFEPKPFKSGNKINTVRGVLYHPLTKNLCFTFFEDNTFVECFRCSLAPVGRYEMSADLKQRCCEVIKNRVGLVLSIEDLDYYLKTETALCEHLTKYNAPDDTFDREMLIDTISRKICGLTFPINGDSQETIMTFFKKFRDACEELGYEIV